MRRSTISIKRLRLQSVNNDDDVRLKFPAGTKKGNQKLGFLETASLKFSLVRPCIHLLTMAPSKRKRSPESDHVASDSATGGSSDSEIDISSALAGKRVKKGPQPRDSDNEDEDLENLIRESIFKRNVKGGTELLKKTKGKAKIVKGEVGGGSFQSMGVYLETCRKIPVVHPFAGLHPSLLRSLTLQGFRIPTPIQRLSIPALLANPPRDLVGMARTGSGKSLAYLIPLVQRLGGRHSTTFGARALILLPTRELALQVLKVGKELARGWHNGEGDHAGDSKDTSDRKMGQGLRWSLIVGGEGMDEQFEMIASNPDMSVVLFHKIPQI